MTEVFDVAKLPERRLSVRRMVALHPSMNFGDAVEIANRDMAMQLATRIMDGEPLFQKRGDYIAGTTALEYGADCIVLTTEEYTEMRREAFEAGLRHAQGFMPKNFGGV